MKRFVNWIAAALMLTTVCATAAAVNYRTYENDPLGTKMYTLQNGLKVYMSVNKETPRIQTYIAVKVGGKNDPSETTGLAHYFEHLMFKGSEKFGTSNYALEKPMLDEIEQLFEVYRQTKDEAERAQIYHRIDSISYEASKLAIPNEYDKLMAMIGADGTNAWTSSDETVYVEDIPSNQIDNWARIEADRFRNVVIRGFHTELETIYEEKNMSLTKDSRKIWEALDAALFPNHPYGQQTVLGTQEHLKNPSITNVKKYHDTYYVPNNIAICVSGDFDPDEMVAAIEKYFGDWMPNPVIPTLKFEPEKPIEKPVVKEVYGLESERIALGWRLPGAADLKAGAVAEIASAILYNGQAGLMDLDVNQQQKAMFVYAGAQSQPDYGTFIAMGSPKQGQTLEQVQALILEEVAKLRAGEFDEALIPATINNIKLGKMQQLESNSARAQQYVNAFINGIPWQDACREMERYGAVTKKDVVAWANKYLNDNNFAVVYKRQGEDTTVSKISAPKITPIVTNRDMQSDFLKEIAATTVQPIEPVFVDFAKDMAVLSLAKGVQVLYKKNKLNDLFQLEFTVNRGRTDDPALPLAFDYLSYLGTQKMDASEIAMQMYALGCDFSASAGATSSTLHISGLGENMGKAIEIVESLVFGAVADEEVLAEVKADMLKNRADAKKNQQSCYGALRTYAIYGGDYIKKVNLSDAQIEALSSQELLGKVRDLFSKGHEVLYYGPASEKALFKTLRKYHHVERKAEALPEHFISSPVVEKSKVVMCQYDAKQIYYYQYSDRGEQFDPASEAVLELYNEYFGGGMNTIVFQEMREARGLAYSAWARLAFPSYVGDTYGYHAFIATQNDKMRQAIEAFDEIINNMPVSEAAFAVAKDAIISRMRTDRVTGIGVLRAYKGCRRLGLKEPVAREVFAALPALSLADVAAAQQKWVKDRQYVYMILGDIKDLDTEYLKTLGEVEIATAEDVFGY